MLTRRQESLDVLNSGKSLRLSASLVPLGRRRRRRRRRRAHGRRGLVTRPLERAPVAALGEVLGQKGLHVVQGRLELRPLRRAAASAALGAAESGLGEVLGQERLDVVQSRLALGSFRQRGRRCGGASQARLGEVLGQGGGHFLEGRLDPGPLGDAGDGDRGDRRQGRRDGRGGRWNGQGGHGEGLLGVATRYESVGWIVIFVCFIEESRW